LIFDEEFRARLEVLKRIVARALAGRGGAGRSPLRDRGGRVEFAGHRAYVAGDDARSVDWAAYARLETLVVKEFEAPRESELLLICDRSGSMGCFGKDAAALRLAAALGWLGLAAGARVACCSRGGASPWLTAQERFPELIHVLEKLPVGGEADLPAAIEQAPPLGTGRRTAVLLSDLYEAEPLARSLAVLGKRASNVIAVHLLAGEELSVPEDAVVRLKDAESGDVVELETGGAVRNAYRARVEGFLQERRSLLAKHGARWTRVAPDDDLVDAVERVVVGGEAR